MELLSKGEESCMRVMHSIEDAYLTIPEHPNDLDHQVRTIESIYDSGVSIYNNRFFYQWVQQFDGLKEETKNVKLPDYLREDLTSEEKRDLH